MPRNMLSCFHSKERARENEEEARQNHPPAVIIRAHSGPISNFVTCVFSAWENISLPPGECNKVLIKGAEIGYYHFFAFHPPISLFSPLVCKFLLFILLLMRLCCMVSLVTMVMAPLLN